MRMRARARMREAPATLLRMDKQLSLPEQVRQLLSDDKDAFVERLVAALHDAVPEEGQAMTQSFNVNDLLKSVVDGMLGEEEH